MFTAELDNLIAFVRRNPRLFVLTGAGCSTASGIPDYRDLNGDWKRQQPVDYQDFMRFEHTRKRYWARSMAAWPAFISARPNAAHRALAEMEQVGYVESLVTQNVDGLHNRAGSRRMIDLHGRLDSIVCTHCEHRIGRDEFQRKLLNRNPAFLVHDAELAPDGDADLEGIDFDAFLVPDCPSCGGTLKPDVVFFGEPVRRTVFEQARAALDKALAVLVVGSSLMVYSGFRFCRMAAEQEKPIAAINLGRTRADEHLELKLEADCSTVLQKLAAELPVAAHRLMAEG